MFSRSTSVISLKNPYSLLNNKNFSSKKILNRNAYNILNLNSNTNTNTIKQSNIKNINKNDPNLKTNINNIKNYHISMLSKQKQLSLNKNKILLINLTSSITEIARLFILGGFNIYLYDKEIINENDIKNNFFLKENDLGKNRIDVIYNYLMPLTPTVNITKIDDYTLIKDYKIAIVGFSNYFSLIEYEEYFNRKDILYFCLNSSGLYAFCYHNLNDKNCKKFLTKEKNEIKNKIFQFKIRNDIIKDEEKINENIFNQKNIILPSTFLKKSDKFFEKERKTEKDYLVFAIYLLEIYYKKNVDKKNIKKVMKNEMNGNNNFVKKMFYIENFLIQRQYFEIINNQDLMDTIKKFVINFNSEFNPVCHIIAKKLFFTLFNFFKYNIVLKKTFLTYNSDITEYDSETFLQ